MTTQYITTRGLKSALSDERLAAYSLPDDADELDVVARYTWNLALSCAMQPALHALELTLRNHLYTVSTKIVNSARLRFKAVPCWLDADPSLLELHEQQEIEGAKALLSKGQKQMTPGRLISKLHFGFWVSLCKNRYEQGRGSGPALWPDLAKHGFPFLPKPLRTRSAIFHRVNALRDLRNRVSHHEPIWDRDLLSAHQRVIETIGWMNASLANVVSATSPLTDVFAKGVAHYRPMAERHVRGNA